MVCSTPRRSTAQRRRISRARHVTRRWRTNHASTVPYVDLITTVTFIRVFHSCGRVAVRRAETEAIRGGVIEGKDDLVREDALSVETFAVWGDNFSIIEKII